ncbi:hypothetical protein N7462_002729 [Penicillium macrosclerotiorum]|uniref:uncharacterized protein n=1 Tax=Penicillium macrosclerotiorum TaxID=303699 RepID=UPI002548F8FA|nr:uncharacterized protein N7462_002729 [Penicillium macrosclerotiorum]KAJ5693306.1 hypothetical protein N7462_002729 [Penicillium macrosclerotiorum]
MAASTPSNDLPNGPEFIDILIHELAGFQAPSACIGINELDTPRRQQVHQEDQPQNPLARLAPSQLARLKPLMLTLHCIFPNDLLPALDILDRRLVRRFVRSDKKDAAPAEPGQDPTIAAEGQPLSVTKKTNTDPKNATAPDEDMFFVISTSAIPHQPGTTSSHLPTQEQEKGYETRLHAWNCTCPTFALSAFRDLGSRLGWMSAAQRPSDLAILRHRERPVDYPFGGTLTCRTDRVSPPVCKHILACVLFARCPGLFGCDEDGRRLVSTEEMAGWCAGWGG